MVSPLASISAISSKRLVMRRAFWTSSRSVWAPMSYTERIFSTP